jgi:hypothetical protein
MSVQGWGVWVRSEVKGVNKGKWVKLESGNSCR